jgi:hypothetical protein
MYRRYAGCLEDAILERYRLQVIDIRGMPATPSRPSYPVLDGDTTS